MVLLFKNVWQFENNLQLIFLIQWNCIGSSRVLKLKSMNTIDILQISNSYDNFVRNFII